LREAARDAAALGVVEMPVGGRRGDHGAGIEQRVVVGRGARVEGSGRRQRRGRRALSRRTRVEHRPPGLIVLECLVGEAADEREAAEPGEVRRDAAPAPGAEQEPGDAHQARLGEAGVAVHEILGLGDVLVRRLAAHRLPRRLPRRVVDACADAAGRLVDALGAFLQPCRRLPEHAASGRAAGALRQLAEDLHRLVEEVAAARSAPGARARGRPRQGIEQTFGIDHGNLPATVFWGQV
jgi:hypothetical protein